MAVKKLKTFVNEKIYRQRPKLLGHAVSAPYMKTVGGQSVWVVDVIVHSDGEELVAVPIAENNRQIRNFCTKGTPVELQRSNSGQFYVSGLSDTQKGNVVGKTYSPITEGLAFSQGWRLEGTSWETGNGNEADEGTPATTTYSYTVITLTYSELTYGTTPYGATRTVRTP